MIYKATFTAVCNHICIAMAQISATLPKTQYSIWNGCVLPTSTRAPFANINRNASGSFSLLQSSEVPNWDKQKDQGCSVNKGELLPGSQSCCPWGSLAPGLILAIKQISRVLLPAGRAHLFGLTVCVYLFHINTPQQPQCDHFRELLEFGEVLYLFSIFAHFILKNM